jgi:hypothetical protein
MLKAIAAAVVAATLLLGPASAAPGPACHNPVEIEADQAFLFQTDLMMIGEACKDPAYDTFLRRNRSSIQHYQAVMTGMFRRNGAARPDNSFDSYRTRLANQASIRNGSIPVASFCAGAREMVSFANSLGDPDFRRYAATQAIGNRNNYRLCRN